MFALRSRKAGLARIALLAVFACSVVQAEDRHFEPKPQPSQAVQAANGMAIVTGKGERISAGAAVTSVSAKQGVLAVSLKNTGPEALDFNDDDLQVTSAGKELKLRRVDEGAGNEIMQDKCAHATASSQLSCNADSFNKRQQDRVAKAAANRLSPGQLATRQYQFSLPKRSGSEPVTINVKIEVGGESISFDFAEAD